MKALCAAWGCDLAISVRLQIKSSQIIYFSQTQEYKVNDTTYVQYEKIQKVYTSLPFTL